MPSKLGAVNLNETSSDDNDNKLEYLCIAFYWKLEMDVNDQPHIFSLLTKTFDVIHSSSFFCGFLFVFLHSQMHLKVISALTALFTTSPFFSSAAKKRDHCSLAKMTRLTYPITHFSICTVSPCLQWNAPIDT